MSYMDLPRLTLLGRFFTDPSTVDNDPAHYEVDCERRSPWQMPNGQHRFYFKDVTIQAALDPNGNLVAGGDPLLGAAVSHDMKYGPARIVDLDVYQQGVPGLWGLNLRIQVSDTLSLTGDVDTPFLNSLRFTRVLPTRGWASWDEYGSSSFGGDSYACGVYQSVIRIPRNTWPNASGSDLLDALRNVSFIDPDGSIMLSLRMVLDGYQNVETDTTFKTGRMLATIGPVLDSNEPLRSLRCRWLRNRPLLQNTAEGKANKITSPWYWPDFYAAPFYFAQRPNGSKAIVIDMANAIATQTAAGSPVDLGNLTLQFDPYADPALGQFQVNDDLYGTLGGVMEISVSDDQWDARHTPVQIVTDANDLGGPVLWKENSPLTIAADLRSVMMTSEPGSPHSRVACRVWVGMWGEPHAPADLKVKVVPVVNGIQGATVPWVAGYQGDTPQAKGALKANISQPDRQGWATVILKAVKDPGYRTPYLDGQLYFIVVYTGETPPNLKQAPAPQESQISCVVWSRFQVNRDPEWKEVAAILEPYVKLFPYMTGLIDLSDAHTFQIFGTNPPWQPPPPSPPQLVPPTPYTLPDGKQIARGAIPFYMTRPLTDPRYMPISRDLSPNKMLTVLYFLFNLQQEIPVVPPQPPPGPITG